MMLKIGIRSSLHIIIEFFLGIFAGVILGSFNDFEIGVPEKLCFLNKEITESGLSGVSKNWQAWKQIQQLIGDNPHEFLRYDRKWDLFVLLFFDEMCLRDDNNYGFWRK